MPRNPKSCATPTTSPTATTCAATSRSIRASRALTSTRAPAPGPSTTDKGDRHTARFCVMATGCLSAPNHPKFPGMETFKGATYHTGEWPHEGVDFTGRTRGHHRHGLVVDPVDPDHRRAGQASDRLPAHGQLRHPRPQPPLERRVPARLEGQLRRAPRQGQDDHLGHPVRLQRRQGARDAAGGQDGRIPEALGPRRPVVPGRLQRSAARQGGQRHGRGVREGQDPAPS